jgi:hypothetical protein
MAFDWVRPLAAVPANKKEPGEAVRQRFRGLTAALVQHRGSLGALAGVFDHFHKVTRSYWPGRFRCYDVAGLPWTTNELEQLFGSYRHHKRRCSGRKVACPGTVVRGAVRLVAAAVTRLRPTTATYLVPSDLTMWRDLFESLERCQTVQTLGRRFRRDPVAYLKSHEDPHFNPTLPTLLARPDSRLCGSGSLRPRAPRTPWRSAGGDWVRSGNQPRRGRQPHNRCRAPRSPSGSFRTGPRVRSGSRPRPGRRTSQSIQNPQMAIGFVSYRPLGSFGETGVRRSRGTAVGCPEALTEPWPTKLGLGSFGESAARPDEGRTIDPRAPDNHRVRLGLAVGFVRGTGRPEGRGTHRSGQVGQRRSRRATHHFMVVGADSVD